MVCACRFYPHQPSANIFFLFDRVILLSEGYMIYNGPPQLVKEYFERQGLRMSRFSNPADKLSNIAAEPKTVLGERATVIELYKQCSIQLAEYMTLSEKA